MKFLDKFTTHAYALLRIASGLMFMAHGVHKFFNFPTDFPWPLNPMTTAAGGIELIGGSLIVLGLFTRPVAFICSGMAAVAYWMAHGSQGLYPITNGGEIVALYSFIFLFIATKGAGIWSLDNRKL